MLNSVHVRGSPSRNCRKLGSIVTPNYTNPMNIVTYKTITKGSWIVLPIQIELPYEY